MCKDFVLIRPIEGFKSTALYPTFLTVGFTALYYNFGSVSPQSSAMASSVSTIFPAIVSSSLFLL